MWTNGLQSIWGDKLTGVIMTVGSILGVGLAILLFFFLPTVLFNLLQDAVASDISGWRSLFEGVLRIAIFLGYVLLVSLGPRYQTYLSISWRGAQDHFSVMKTTCPLLWKMCGCRAAFIPAAEPAF